MSDVRSWTLELSNAVQCSNKRLLKTLMDNYDPSSVTEEEIGTIANAVALAVDEDNMNAVKTIMSVNEPCLASAVCTLRVGDSVIRKQDASMLNLLVGFNCVAYDRRLANLVVFRHSPSFDIRFLLVKAPKSFLTWLATSDNASLQLLELVGSLDNTAVVCPITLDPIKTAVVTCDGHVYERGAIEGWLGTHDTSPYTNLVLESKALYPCHILSR